MRVFAFDEKESAEKKVFLRLTNDATGVTLAAYGKDGVKMYAGNLMHFSHSGEASVYDGASELIGFKLNAVGRLDIKNL
jgi:hypothetical protein